jgi:hypothetical protein
MRRKKNELSLLNFEGDALWAKKAGKDEYVVYDQWSSIVDVLTEDDFLNFLDGKLELSDSSGKTWNFRKEHYEAKPHYRDIINFMNHGE